MKVLQLIDSLNPGGAERMAVNYANMLHECNIESHICATREEGLLNRDIVIGVNYLFLNKKSTFDLSAFLKLRVYLIEHQIDILHAHNTSFFLGTVLKFSLPNIKLIWHDHYGSSDFLDDRKTTILKFCSNFFDGIISVNSKLKNWAVKNLSSKIVVEIKNFISFKTNEISEVKVLGNTDDFKIICVANLRLQKDHVTLLKAFEILREHYNMSLHLVGNNPNTNHSKSILKKIKQSPFRDKIFYYGVQNNVANLLEQCDLGVLSSISEGLPLALLEYGYIGLPVVCTNVGQCNKVIGNNGKLVPSNNPIILAKEILDYYKNIEKRKIDANNLKINTIKNYSSNSVIEEVISVYHSALKA